METKQNNYGGVMGGAILIVLGLIFLAATQGFLNLDWGNIWPLFLILAGAATLSQAIMTTGPRRRAGLVFGGTIPFLLGVFFLATITGLLSWSDQAVLWPIYPLIVGVAFLAAYFTSGREQSAYLLPGSIITLIALLFLGITLTGIGFSYIATIWPVFLIVAGLLILMGPRLGWGEKRN
ncbi:MAG: LiaI-LiaF-like domain-containing protein [Chloroflexia bacterium]